MKKFFVLVLTLCLVVISNIGLAANVKTIKINVTDNELAIGWFRLGMNTSDAVNSCSNMARFNTEYYPDSTSYSFDTYKDRDEYKYGALMGLASINKDTPNLKVNTIYIISISITDLRRFDIKRCNLKTPSGVYLGMPYTELAAIYNIPLSEFDVDSAVYLELIGPNAKDTMTIVVYRKPRIVHSITLRRTRK